MCAILKKIRYIWLSLYISCRLCLVHTHLTLIFIEAPRYPTRYLASISSFMIHSVYVYQET